MPLTLALGGPPPNLTLTHAAGDGWLAIAGTGVAYTLWFRGIDRLPVSALTFLGLLSPLVATGLGWLVLDQGLTPIQLGGVALVIAAVALPQLPTTRPPAAAIGTAPSPSLDPARA